MDRRIRKTRESLQQALLTLLREKSLEQIEIQEITEVANTARVTFYRHYATKEELLMDSMERIYQDFEEIYAAQEVETILDFTMTPPIQPLFELLEQDREFYKKLFMGTASAIIQMRLRHYIVQEVTRTFGAHPHYANLPLFLIANHIASCNIGNIMWWLGDDLPYSAQYMAQITHRTSLAGAMNVVGLGSVIKMPPDNLWHISDQS